MTDIALAAEDTDVGCMERMLLLETTSPAYEGRYDRDDSLKAMRLMRQVVENRLRAPVKSRFGEPSDADSWTDIIAVGSQFAGMGDYPELPAALKNNLAEFLRLANAARDPRQPVYAQFVQDAITASTEAAPPQEARFPNVVAWRTHGASSPGAGFRLLVTVQGNDFYSADLVPPMPPRRRRRGR